MSEKQNGFLQERIEKLEILLERHTVLLANEQTRVKESITNTT